MGLHAKFSPSGAHRWMNCPGSVAMEQGKPDSSGDASALGTLLHAMAEWALEDIRAGVHTDTSAAVADAWRGVYADPGEVSGEFATTKGEKYARALLDRTGFDVTNTTVRPYVRYIVENYSEAANYGIEARADCSYLGADLWGTADWWCLLGDTLHVDDLKTGRHPVDPVDNPQGAIYALGLLRALKPLHRRAVKRVVVTIHQHAEVRTWVVDATYLRKTWEPRIREAIRQARTSAPLDAGEWCRFCKAKAECAAFAERGVAAAAAEFELAPLPVDDPGTTLQTMTGEQIADVLDKFALLEAFVSDALPIITERVYNGEVEVPGYKVIRGTKHKAWVDPAKAEQRLAEFGDEAYKRTLLTPTQAIKKFGDEACADLWHKPTGDLKLVTSQTRGKAVTAAATEFVDD